MMLQHATRKIDNSLHRLLRGKRVSQLSLFENNDYVIQQQQLHHHQQQGQQVRSLSLKSSSFSHHVHHYCKYYQSNHHQIRFMNIPPKSTDTDFFDDDSFIADESKHIPKTDSDDEADYFMSQDLEFYDELTNEYFNSDDIQKKKKQEEAEEKDAAMRQAIRDEIDSRTGRLWEDPLAISDEDWSSGRTYDDLPDWNENICSRVSLERVKVHPGKIFFFLSFFIMYCIQVDSFLYLLFYCYETQIIDGVPTLDVLAKLQLPPSHPPHPALGNPKRYLKHRKKVIHDNIYNAVVQVAQPDIEKIQSMENWNDKQDAIDDLFERIHDAVRSVKVSSSNKTNSGDDNEYLSVVLGNQPDFPKLVERALEDYLRNVVRNEKNQSKESPDDKQSKIEPIFMDLIKNKVSTVDDQDIPKIIHPIKPHAKDGPGRMVEEWELSSKKDTKRIMCRECISEIANTLESGAGSRVFVNGSRGAGKSTALTAIVASARLSGHIVLYLPDGQRLSKHGFYLEPNVLSKEKGDLLFDLPILTNEVCKQILESHEKDLQGMEVSNDTLCQYLTSDELQKLEAEVKNEGGKFGVVDLLKVGSENLTIGAGCYGAVIHTLMNQEDKPFTVVMDEFNCYYGQGHYFHAEYDSEVRNSIPLNKITLFRPLLDAIGVEKKDDGTFITKQYLPIKNGGIVVGMTESHAVGRQINASLKEAIQTSGCHMVHVPQYSPLEVEHILANYEIIGIGRLRYDRGATVMNDQEVAYLRMVSGGIGQRLLDSCVH